jgi:hypothetical protein
VKQSELASISNHGGLTGQPISENLLEADPSFPGLHSPSHRKEDVTELFSAFVFQIEVQPRELDRLAEFANRATAAGLGPLRNFFGRCD